MRLFEPGDGKIVANIITNIMTIDLEDWFMNIDISMWNSYERRVVTSTHKILNLLNRSNVKATFFVLGYIAEIFPELITEICMKGHEIATHGYSHKRITDLNPLEFEKDLLKSIKILEEITGKKVQGYRAPWFTIMDETSWAIDLLKEIGLKYDSSIFPIKTYRYGQPGVPLHPYHISARNIKIDHPQEEFLEYTLSVYTVPFLNRNIPISGGFYFRLFPYPFIKYAITRINRLGRPVVFYIHPWEFDPMQPKIKELEWHHYFRLDTTENKFKKLLNDFKFTSIHEWEN